MIKIALFSLPLLQINFNRARGISNSIYNKIFEKYVLPYHSRMEINRMIWQTNYRRYAFCFQCWGVLCDSIYQQIC